jgi:hypothetical protein
MRLSEIKVEVLGSSRFSNRKKIIYSMALGLVIVIGIYLFHIIGGLEQAGKMEANSFIKKILGWVFLLLDLGVGFLCLEQWLLPFRNKKR